jgi:uncharacterized membrane protein (GlpM family)
MNSALLDAADVAGKALLGGGLVVAFAVLAQALSPKRFAGVFAAAPSVALASLFITTLHKGPDDARRDCVGMIAGAIGFLIYALVAPAAMRRWGSLRGSATALFAWAAVTAAALPVVALVPAAKSVTTGAVIGSGTGAPLPKEGERPALRFDAGKIKEASGRDLVIRFAFGAGTSVVAAMVSLLAGPAIGGVFLAFPAILLASLTLVADEEGRSKARDDARGAAAGALGLAAFAAVGAALFVAGPSPAAFVAASAAWTVVAVGAFLIAWRAGAGADEEQGKDA